MPDDPSLPTVVTKAYDILLWCVNHVGKFPRSHRFVLGERIETAMLDTVLLLGSIRRCSRDRSTGEAALRGGSWNNHPTNLRSANRNRNNPTKRNANNGVRCAQDASSVTRVRLFIPEGRSVACGRLDRFRACPFGGRIAWCPASRLAK